MAVTKTDQSFLTSAYKSGLLDESAVKAMYPSQAMLPDEPQACAAELVNSGLLTPFQAKQLLAGKTKGFVLGPYRVKDQIGKGGMGVVYLAEHVGLKRDVAVKVLPKEYSTDKLALERFFREARAAAALDHANIVRLHDIAHEMGVHFLVMEYVEGMTLEELTSKTGRLHYGQAAEYIAQAAYGLQHAHDKGFIHRDIKPSNLMLTKEGKVKILDMGLAKTIENPNDNLTGLLGDGAVAGTADFVSPEQALNDPMDARSDIYSLGATLYALITGKPPYFGNTSQKLLQHHMAEPPRIDKFVQGIPEGICEVVATMMAKSPEDRYASATDVIEALAPWLPGGAEIGSTGTTKNLKSYTSTKVGTRASLTKAKLGTKTKLLPVEAQKKKTGLYIGGGIAALVVVGGLFAAFSGDGKPTAKTNPVPIIQENTNNNISTTPPPAQKLAKGEFARMKLDGVAPKKVLLKENQRLSTTDPQWLPKPWSVQSWKTGMTGSIEVLALQGNNVLEFKNTSQNSANWGLEFYSAEPLCRLKPKAKARILMEYRTDPGGKGWVDARFDNRSSDTIQRKVLGDTKGEWQKIVMDITAVVEMPIMLFMANLSPANVGFQIKSINVVDPGAYVEPAPMESHPNGITFAKIPLDNIFTACTKDNLFTPTSPLNIEMEEWGQKVFRDIPFQLVDPANQTKNVILLYSSQGTAGPTAPREVRIPINRSAKTLHVLGGVAGWGYPFTAKKEGDRNGTARGTDCIYCNIVYADGTNERTTWKNGEHIADYSIGSGSPEATKSVPGSELFMLLKNGTRQIRYLALSPTKQTEIKELVFEKAETDPYTAPLIFAVTAELPIGPIQWGKYEKVSLWESATANTDLPLYASNGKFSIFDHPRPEFRAPNGVPFEVPKATKEKPKNVIVLNSNQMPGQAMDAPEAVTVAVNKPANQIHILGGVGGFAWPWKKANSNETYEGQTVVDVSILYADGTRENLAWKNGIHIADHYKRFDVPESEFVTTLTNGQQVRYLSIKPKKKDVIQSLTFTKGETKHVAPAVFAITIEPIIATKAATPDVVSKPKPVENKKMITVSLARAANVDTSKTLPGANSSAMGIVPEKFGKVTYNKIDFELADPALGNNAVMIHGSGSGGRPQSAKASVFQGVKKLHLLSGVALGGFPITPEKAPAMLVKLHTTNGNVEEITLENKVHFADYGKREDVPGSVFAAEWKSGRQVRTITLEPKTTEVIREIEFVAPCVGINPIILGITIEIP